MPTQFLSRSEIERLESFPEEIDRDELAEHFGEDLEFFRSQYGPEGQLGIAVQLCTLRWLGFIPEDLTAAPAAAVQSLAAVLDVPARALFDYSVRLQTRREHRPLVRAHAGWRTFGEAEQASLGGRLVEVALEHERPTLLLEELRRELRSQRIERPAIGRLERLVAWARERAHDRTYELLAEQLTPEVRAGLDALLSPDSEQSGRTPLSWLRSRPTSITKAAMRRELSKRAWVIEQVGADRLDLGVLPPNRLAWLAQIGRRSIG